jgi:capsular polysaccharide biosynthesis protein
MTWSVPSSPASPEGEPTLVTVEDAYLSPLSHGPIGTLTPPKRWFRGAVYDSDNRLVPSSQRLGGVNGYNWAPADPSRLPTRSDKADRLEGTWLYGGHWIQHFGHFSIETITTLWPRCAVQGLVFHKYLKRPWAIEPWQSRLLELCGYGDLPVRVVDARHPRSVERLLVPGRAVVAHGWAHDEAVEVWDRVASPFTGRQAPSRVFLSRTAHNERRRAEGHRSGERTTAAWDQGLDRIFDERGFAVVRPEELSIDEQLSLVANADTIAGASGSALHLSAFAPSSTRVLELGDQRSVAGPVPSQLVIDAARGHRHAFVRGDMSLEGVESAVAALT